MTKLLMCQDCGDIVSPDRTAYAKRACRCGRHEVWWTDPIAGKLKVSDLHFSEYEGPRCWILGIHNGFLTWPERHTSDSIKTIVDNTSPSYLFKTLNSLIIRIRPGESNDTSYEYNRPAETTMTTGL
jgi:hypothetical protein